MQADYKKILIVEDERKIARFLQMELEHEGFKTSIEANGRIALDRIMQESFDLVLLDIMLPEMDGIEICKRARELSEVPIIMVTAKDDLIDKVMGLDTGADDYITKPFATQELIARIRAALRKNKPALHSANNNEFRVQNLVLYPERYEVHIDQQSVELTKKEYDLLEYLIRNRNIVLNRERILQEVWGYEFMGDTKIVDVYIRYLRSKLDERYKRKYIHTVRGVGYVVKD
ncbi:response regulator transcription factor [Pelosinus sp. UFO1]|uniref:response regulator transcription factor n=1 Tax=Pelosinus sp. UFO1 TaxID=484770 RepID=UPI0004D1399F|nr:response regulator transcription factor [Pelosinus sp. UFO1]AIF50320.1 two component transcriptional regulator, winged helix family [Pelosinus sp. UFO1]